MNSHRRNELIGAYYQHLTPGLGMNLHRRVLSESHWDTADRLDDSASVDTNPDDCWRCCAVASENDLGTCNTCLADLRDRP